MGDHQRGAGHIGGVAGREPDGGQVDAVARCEAAERRGGGRRQPGRIAHGQNRVRAVEHDGLARGDRAGDRQRAVGIDLHGAGAVQGRDGHAARIEHDPAVVHQRGAAGQGGVVQRQGAGIGQGAAGGERVVAAGQVPGRAGIDRGTREIYVVRTQAGDRAGTCGQFQRAENRAADGVAAIHNAIEHGAGIDDQAVRMSSGTLNGVAVDAGACAAGNGAGIDYRAGFIIEKYALFITR